VFRAYNRGIIVAALYSAAAAVLFELFGPPELRASQNNQLVVLGILGMVGGTIGGFSNTNCFANGRRDLKRNLLDAVMISVWAANLLLVFNLVSPSFSIEALAQLLGAFAGGSVVGGAIGEPIVGLVGKLQIKGRRPFAWVNSVTESIDNANARFVMRVLIQTVVAGILVALAFIAFMVVLVILIIAVAFIVLGKVLGGAGSGSSNAETAFVPGTGHDLHSAGEAAAAAGEEAERREMLLKGAGGPGSEFYASGQYGGRVQADGTILTARGDYAGKVDVQANSFGKRYIHDARGNDIGTVDKEGFIRDSHGNSVGKSDRPDSAGTREVRDDHGSYVGARSKREK
jgi:hypothetical protein